MKAHTGHDKSIWYMYAVQNVCVKYYLFCFHNVYVCLFEHSLVSYVLLALSVVSPTNKNYDRTNWLNGTAPGKYIF